MPNRPELPTFFAHKSSVYNVLPDPRPMTWGIWDLDGHFGEMRLAGGEWTAQLDDNPAVLGPVPTWQQAITDMLTSRSPAAA